MCHFLGHIVGYVSFFVMCHFLEQIVGCVIFKDRWLVICHFF